MSGLAQVIIAIAALVTACATAYGSVINSRNQRILGGIHKAVETQNGLTMAALADRAEGRRIGTDIPEGERTVDEQHYVDVLREHDERASQGDES